VICTGTQYSYGYSYGWLDNLPAKLTATFSLGKIQPPSSPRATLGLALAATHVPLHISCCCAISSKPRLYNINSCPTVLTYTSRYVQQSHNSFSSPPLISHYMRGPCR